MASDDWDAWRDAELDADLEAEAQVVAPPPGAEDRVLAAVLAATAGAGAGAGASGGGGAATASAWIKGALLGALVGGAVVAVLVTSGSPDAVAPTAGWDGGGEVVTVDGGVMDGMSDGIDNGMPDGTLLGLSPDMAGDRTDGTVDGTFDDTDDGIADDTVREREAPAKPSKPTQRRPRAPSPADTLRAESTLLAAARGRLAAGDAEGALARAETHRRRFARGRLWQEREVIAVKALWAMGRREAAQARAARLVERAPDSAYRRALAPMLPEAP